MLLRGVILKKRIPLLASPRGGVAASPRKWREASLSTPPGWCSLSHRSGHHPVLAVMRGGELAFLKMSPSLDSCASRGGDCAGQKDGVHIFHLLPDVGRQL